MNKTNQSVLFVCYLFWINLLPMLIASFSITNKQAGSISPNAALYQPPVFAAAACIILLPLYWSYRSGRHTHTYFANRNLIPMRKKIVWSATYLGLLFLIGTYGHPILEWMFGIPPQELENQLAIIEWVRSLPAILVLADVVLVAPLAEEWLFRGILLNIFGDTLQTFAGRFTAVALSALIFGFMHSFYDWPALAIYGAMGAILCTAYLHLRDIRWSIAVHMANNAVAISSIYSGLNLN